MNKQTIELVLNLMIALPVIILLIYVFVKFGGSKLQNMQKSRFIKIIERVPVSKESCILIVKIGNDGYVMASSNSRIEILLKLESDDLRMLEESKNIPQYGSINDFIKKIMAKRKGKDE